MLEYGVENYKKNLLNCTFKPKINSKSRAIVRTGSADAKRKPYIYDKESILKHVERHMVAQFERKLTKDIRRFYLSFINRGHSEGPK